MKKQINKSFFTIFKETLQELGDPNVVSSYEINTILKNKGFSAYFFQTGNTAVAFRRLGYENDGYRSKTWVKRESKSIKEKRIETLNEHFKTKDLSFLNQHSDKQINKNESKPILHENKEIKKRFNLSLFWGLIKIQNY